VVWMHPKRCNTCGGLLRASSEEQSPCICKSRRKRYAGPVEHLVPRLEKAPVELTEPRDVAVRRFLKE
jgi:hypothetical protein